jgi:DNA-directed RNA polymerase specialized sigma24 family protein
MESSEESGIFSLPGRFMRAPLRMIDKERPIGYPETSIRDSYKLIARECLWAGLSPADSDDLAQDLWEWLIRSGVPASAIATPWMMGVVRNYIRRFRRRSRCQEARESAPLERAVEPHSEEPLEVIESSEFLDRVSGVLPKRERELLALIRLGYSLPEASRALNIPTGSRAYSSGRLIAYARRELRRRIL